MGGRALAGLGVRDLAGVVVAALIAMEALCWVLANEDRSRRLTQIIGAWRGTRTRVADQASETAAGRPRRRARTAASGPPTLPGSGTQGTG